MRARAFWPWLEKSQLMSAYGATVQRLRPVSITHRDHFVNVVGLGDLPHAARTPRAAIASIACIQCTKAIESAN